MPSEKLRPVQKSAPGLFRWRADDVISGIWILPLLKLEKSKKKKLSKLDPL